VLMRLPFLWKNGLAPSRRTPEASLLAEICAPCGEVVLGTLFLQKGGFVYSH
jgi:hypothetical protein